MSIEAYREGLLAGTWTPDDSRRMLSISSDPDALIAEIKQANQDPAVAAALQRMIQRFDPGSGEAPRTSVPDSAKRRATAAALAARSK